MASRRMFSLSVIDTDPFLALPATSQMLYFHLAMRADDDGFVDKPETIRTITKTSTDDFKLLLEKGYILTFNTGVLVIRHWRLHNYIQKDRKKDTLYKREIESLQVVDGVYDYKPIELVSNLYPDCIQLVSNMETQVRLGKDSIDKVSLGEGSIDSTPTPSTSTEPKIALREQIPPKLEWVMAYAESRGVDKREAEYFMDYYVREKWIVKSTRERMKDWQQSFRSWERNIGNWNNQSKTFAKDEPKKQKEKKAKKKKYEDITE